MFTSSDRLFYYFDDDKKINTHTTVVDDKKINTHTTVVDEDERRPQTLDSTDTDHCVYFGPSLGSNYTGWIHTSFIPYFTSFYFLTTQINTDDETTTQKRKIEIIQRRCTPTKSECETCSRSSFTVIISISSIYKSDQFHLVDVALISKTVVVRNGIIVNCLQTANPHI